MENDDMAPDIRELAGRVQTAGSRMGLPLVAACIDISSARPAVDETGTPIASFFRFTHAARDYWRWGDLALGNSIVAVIRHTAEPFFYDGGIIGGWRPMDLAVEVETQARVRDYSVRSAIVSPVRLPGSTIGAVVWATDQDGVDVAKLFRKHAMPLQGLALRFVAACDAVNRDAPKVALHRLTRREIQCLKLAAAGKTDGEIGTILGVAVPTVRFHLKKVGGKLGENGKLRTIQRAAQLGFVGSH